MFCHILPTYFYCNIYNIHNVRDFYQILPSLLNSTKFCQDYNLKPILPYIRVNWVIKLIIYTLSSCVLISFSYVMSWLYHIVHIRSLIISTSLYIIVTRTHSVTLYRSRPLLKLKKYNHLTKEEEDFTNILFILILLISLYSYKRIITINSLKYFIKRKL